MLAVPAKFSPECLLTMRRQNSRCCAHRLNIFQQTHLQRFHHQVLAYSDNGTCTKTSGSLYRTKTRTSFALSHHQQLLFIQLAQAEQTRLKSKNGYPVRHRLQTQSLMRNCLLKGELLVMPAVVVEAVDVVDNQSRQ